MNEQSTNGAQAFEPNMVLVRERYRVLGTRPVRHDGADKVTGRALYGADVKLPGMLEGAVVRSPHAHARIVSVDTSEAEAMEGVYGVVTSADMPNTGDTRADLGMGEIKLTWGQNNILARGKALYKGHPVAAVAAVSVHLAELAAEKIRVEYEPLPCVLTAVEAMADDAPVLLDDLRLVELTEETDKGGNVSVHIRQEKGDLAKGFEEADVVVEREFDTATVHQGYIEPQNATALWNNDGRLQIWTSTQGAFAVRGQTSDLLQIPVSRIKVTPMEIGGGFGGKIPVYLEPVAALLSKKTGRPVKLVMSRQDVLEATGPTPGSHVRVKIGAKKDGTITAAEAWMAYESGSVPGAFVVPGSMCIFSSYDVENVRIDGYDVMVNKPSSSPYRAPGATQAAFAAEQVVDELAEKLGIDPIELRLKNAAKEGTRRPDGPKFKRIGLVETLEAMRDHPHYKTPLEGKNRGRGVAVGFWFNVGLDSSCTLAVNADGTVNLVEGSTDIGGTRTSVAMQAAEPLGLAAEDIHPTVADTDTIGFTAVTGGSRTTFATGMAAYEAAQDVIRQMRARAALLWEIEAEAVAFDEGVFASGDRSIGFKELAAKLADTGGPLVGRATVKPGGVGGSFAGNIVDVEIDPETGKTTILRFTCFQDAGKAIHPSYVEGQMQGGSAQGIGWALNEEYFMSSEGVMQNSSLLDYRMPTALDLPMIDTCIIEVANPGHPFGVRGVGEANIVPPPAVVANAIHHTVRVRMERLPMNPPAVLRAMGPLTG